MKKTISFILTVAMVFSIFACTSVSVSAAEVYDTNSAYTFDVGTTFSICARYDGFYNFDSYDNDDPYLYFEFEDGTEYTMDDISEEDVEFSDYIYLEEGECVDITVGTYGEDETVYFEIWDEYLVETFREYTIPSGSYVMLDVVHSDYYSAEITGADYLDVDIEIYDLENDTSENHYISNAGDTEVYHYLNKGEYVYAYAVDSESGNDITFTIACDCGILSDGYFEVGYTYENVEVGTAFEFTAPYSGLFAFESFDCIDPYFEYVYYYDETPFFFGYDDIDFDNENLEFYGEIYLYEGESITCYVDSWEDEESVNFSISYVGDCSHDDLSWYVYDEANAYHDGVDIYCCDHCYCIFDYEVVPRLAPETPKAAGVNSVGGITVTWNEVDGAEDYVVYRRVAGSSTWVALTTTNDTSYFDSNVQNNKFYIYSIRAYNDEGVYSAYDSAKTYTIKCVATPKLTKIANATTGIRIDWTKIAGATGYRVYRRGAGSTYWTYLGTTTNLWYVDNAVKNASGNYYRYTVRAVNSYFSGFDTNGLFTKRLSNPVMKSATSSSKGITVSWSKVNGALGYNVYRKTGNSSWVRIAVVSGVNTTSYVDKTAKKGVTYTYTTKAVCGSYMSAYYSTITCKDKY